MCYLSKGYSPPPVFLARRDNVVQGRKLRRNSPAHGGSAQHTLTCTLVSRSALGILYAPISYYVRVMCLLYIIHTHTHTYTARYSHPSLSIAGKKTGRLCKRRLHYTRRAILHRSTAIHIIICGTRTSANEMLRLFCATCASS